MTSRDHFTTNEELVSEKIIAVTAEQRGVDPLALPPLNEFIDVDAVNALFRSAGNKRTHTAFVEFQYAGYTVAVFQDDGITIAVQERLDDSCSNGTKLDDGNRDKNGM